MLNNETVAVVVRCYNEETQILPVLESRANFVVRTTVVDDGHTGGTSDLVKQLIDESPPAGLVVERCREKTVIRTRFTPQQLYNEEMDPGERKILDQPLVSNTELGYVQRSQLSHRLAFFVSGKVRPFTDAVLTPLSKMVTGCWRASDTHKIDKVKSLNVLSACSRREIFR